MGTVYLVSDSVLPGKITAATIANRMPNPECTTALQHYVISSVVCYANGKRTGGEGDEFELSHWEDAGLSPGHFGEIFVIGDLGHNFGRVNLTAGNQRFTRSETEYRDGLREYVLEQTPDTRLVLARAEILEAVREDLEGMGQTVKAYTRRRKGFETPEPQRLFP